MIRAYSPWVGQRQTTLLHSTSLLGIVEFTQAQDFPPFWINIPIIGRFWQFPRKLADLQEDVDPKLETYVAVTARLLVMFRFNQLITSAFMPKDVRVNVW